MVDGEPVAAAEEDVALSAAARGIARGLRRPSLDPGTLGLIAGLLDFAALGLGLWFAAYAAASGPFASLPAAGFALMSAVAAVGLVRLGGGYRLARLRRFFSGAALVVLAGTGAAGIGVVLGLAPAAAAALLPMAAATLAGFAAPLRALIACIAAWASDCGLTERRAVVVGGGLGAARLLDAFAADPMNDIRVCGIFDDRDDERSPPLVAGVPKLGTVRALLAFARAAEIDMLIITLPLTAEARIREILHALEVLPLDVRLSAYSADLGFRRRSRRADAGLIELAARPLRERERAMKRALDLVAGTVALMLLALPMGAIALAIRLESRGPTIFRQARYGYNHKPVEVLKFRSMYVEQCDPTARNVVTRDDPRVTRVGRFIRKYSLDELPQLVNVLRGELSLVGPRPHVLHAVSSRQEAFAALVENYAARHKVRPGLTGWAQIHGWRGEIDDPEKLRRRFEHDLYYIENWSIALDLAVLALTPLRLLDTRNAY